MELRLYTRLMMLQMFLFPNKDIFIIGGAKIYELALDCCDYLLLTLIHKNLTGDTHFPNYDTSVWKLIDETRMYDIENKFSIHF